jgi:hypothetical protein
VTRTFPLAGVNEALDELTRDAVLGRAALMV